MARDDDQRWPRQLAVGLGAILVVGLLLGGVMSMFALGATEVAGIGDETTSAPVEPSLYFPTGEPSTGEQPTAGPNVTPPAQPSPSPSPTPRRKPRKPKPRLSLQAFPASVSPGQRINLTGVYAGAEGRVLQVQRRESGAWTDFPVDARVVGGSFQTWIATSRSGLQQFRMLDTASGTHSNVVRVTIG